MNRRYKNQRFVLDYRTKSIRAYHERQWALTLEGASSFRAVMSPFRNNRSQKFVNFDSPQLRLQTPYCLEFDHKHKVIFTTC